MFKAAPNMASKSLCIDMQERGVVFRICHPGWVQTEITDHTRHLTP